MNSPKKTRSVLTIICSLFGIAVATIAYCATLQEDRIGSIDFYQDLCCIRDILIENHPGMHNSLDPNFREHLEQSFFHAKRLLASAKSPDQKAAFLHDFGKSFNDAHLWVRYTLNTASDAADVPSQKKSPNVTKVACNVYWVRIPHFEPTESQITDFKSIIGLLSTLRDQTIIFDLRGNGGGNSSWGDQILMALFGEEYTNQKLHEAKSCEYVEWRASPENTEYIHNLVPVITQEFGENHEVTTWIKKVYDGLRHALLMQEHYYVEPAEKNQVSSTKPSQSLFGGKIIAIIDRGCGSACLDFIDGLKTMNTETVFIGETTGADSAYMELRTVPLPSGVGRLGFPIKVYRNRPRGHNVPHIPTIKYSDLKNDHSLQTFVLATLAKNC